MFKFRRFNVVILVTAVVFALTALAAIGMAPVFADSSAVDSTLICTVDDDFDTIDSAWITDRHVPNAFKTTFFDGDNRLEIQIDNAQASVNRPVGLNTIFYNTQGKKMPVTSAGEWTSSAKLYVSADMLSGNTLRRSDLWLRTGDAVEANAVYHIIGIVRNDYADPWNPNAANLLTQWRVWDGDDTGDGWIELPGPTTVGWYELKIVGNATEVKHYIDNVLVYTDNAGLAATPKLTEVFLQAYNFSQQGQSNQGQNYSVYWDDLAVESDCPSITLQAADAPICGSPAEMTIDFSNVSGLYGYEFSVNYDASNVSAAGSFVNSWFDTSTGIPVPGWEGDCSGGVCKFAASLQNPKPAVGTTAPKTVAKIVFTPVAAGNITVDVGGALLSDIDGMPIPVDIGGAEIDFDICGQATVSGQISLQGRATPMNPGWVTLIDTGGVFPDKKVTFDANGGYTATVNVMPGGSAYKMQASHYLYLPNEKAAQTLTPGQILANQNTRLLGGDANNSSFSSAVGVSISDVACIGGNFGGSPANCGAAPDNTNSDINNDGSVNIQDLSIAGGNYGKNPFQAW